MQVTGAVDSLVKSAATVAGAAAGTVATTEASVSECLARDANVEYKVKKKTEELQLSVNQKYHCLRKGSRKCLKVYTIALANRQGEGEHVEFIRVAR